MDEKFKKDKVSRVQFEEEQVIKQKEENRRNQSFVNQLNRA